MYRLMKQMHLPKMSTVKPPKPASKIKENGLCSNLLAQQFDQKAPNLVWVCDFTYVRVGKRFYYICAILDLYARKVIACRVGSKIDRFLAIDTLRDAVQYRGVSTGVMFHTDRGSQFTSSDFRKELDRLHMVQSFSAKGHPYDNAVMECFFKYLKKKNWTGVLFKLWSNSNKVCFPISPVSTILSVPILIITGYLPIKLKISCLCNFTCPLY